MKYDYNKYSNGNILYILTFPPNIIDYDLAINRNSTTFLPDTLIIYNGTTFKVSSKSKLYKLDLSLLDYNYKYDVETKLIKTKSNNYLNKREIKLLIYFRRIPISTIPNILVEKGTKIKLSTITKNKTINNYKIYI